VDQMKETWPLEGNAQGSEHLLKQRTICLRGLHLTYATLVHSASILGAAESNDGEKFGAFISEERFLRSSRCHRLVRREAINGADIRSHISRSRR